MFGRILIIALLAVIGWAVIARSSSGAGHPVRYVVRPTDTLWSIASTHYAGDPRDAIVRVERANHLPGATLTPGETLLLP
jgi:LysM domain